MLTVKASSLILFAKITERVFFRIFRLFVVRCAMLTRKVTKKNVPMYEMQYSKLSPAAAAAAALFGARGAVKTRALNKFSFSLAHIHI